MIGAVLQARMGSTRLPGKVLMSIGNKSLLEHIFYRLKFLRHDVRVILATSDLPGDDRIEVFCKTNHIECFRGSESNVLQRYYKCSKKYELDHIIRLTGDNPFTDIEELDNLIDFHMTMGMDYSNSFDSLPVGAGAEIFTFKALEESFRSGKLPHHLEHVDEYILENPNLFKTGTLHVRDSKNRPEIRLTVDTVDDYKKACFIVQHAKDEFINTEEAIELCLQYA